VRDVVVVGGRLAGLSAGWRLRHWDAIVLESDERVGGRIRSERRGPYLAELGRRLGNLDRYAMTLHGSGMVDEYPNVAHVVDCEENGYDGVFEENSHDVALRRACSTRRHQPDLLRVAGVAEAAHQRPSLQRAAWVRIRLPRPDPTRPQDHLGAAEMKRN